MSQAIWLFEGTLKPKVGQYKKRLVQHLKTRWSVHLIEYLFSSGITAAATTEPSSGVRGFQGQPDG